MSIYDFGRVTVFDRFNLLFEEYIFEHLRHTLNKLTRSLDEQKEKFIKDRVLYNIFLLRRIRDPGFRMFLIDKLRDNNWAIQKAIDYAKSKINEYLQEPISGGELISILRKTREHLMRGGIILRSFLQWEGIDTFFAIRQIRMRMLAIELFREKFLEYIQKQDLVSAKASELLILEYSSGIDISDRMLQQFDYELLLEHRIDNNYYWVYRTNKFLADNIKFWRYYFLQSFLKTIGNFYWGVDLTWPSSGVFDNTIVEYGEIELFNDIANEIIPWIAQSIFGDFDDNMLELLKFELSKMIRDIIAIGTIIWFQRLSPDKKLSLLNDEYPLEKFFDRYIRRLNKCDKKTIILVGKDLIHNHIYGLVLKFFEKILEISSSPDEQFIALDGIAKVYRMLGNYESSVRSLTKALEIYKKNISSKIEAPQYLLAIIYKNLAKSYFFLGDKDNFGEYLNKTLEILDKLDEAHKVNLLYNLVNLARETFNFDGELSFLKMMLYYSNIKDLDSASRRLLIYEAYKRLIFLEDMFDEYGRGAYDKLVFDEIFRKCNDHLEAAIRMFWYHFQVDLALRILDNAYERFKCPRALLLKAILLCAKGDLEEGLRVLDIFYDKFRDNLPRRLYILYLLARGLLFLKQNNIEKAAHEFFEMLPKQIRDEKDLLRYRYSVQMIIEFISGLCPDVDLMKLFDEIAKNFSDQIDKAIFYHNFVGTYVSQLGLLDLALECFNRALEFAIDDEQKSAILTSIGSIYTDMRMHDEAMRYYNKALEAYDKNAMTYRNMAINYGFMARFIDALNCIEKAIKLARNEDERRYYLKDKTRIEQLAKYVIQLELVRSKEAKKFLSTAEKLSLEKIVIPLMSKKVHTVNDDLSYITLMYSKGLERILHEELSLKALNDIRKTYGSRIESRFWRGDRNIEPLPTFLKRLIRYNESISIGTWMRILKEYKQPTSNPVYQLFKRVIANILKKEGIDIIYDACQVLRQYRKAHIETLSIHELIEARSKIIETLNRVIELFYG